MKITSRRTNDRTVVSIIGRIDANTALEVEKEMDAVLSDGVSRVVADMRKVAFISSAGLRVFLSTLKKTRREGGDLRLAGMNDDVLKVFEMTGFSKLFKITRTVKASLRALDR